VPIGRHRPRKVTHAQKDRKKEKKKKKHKIALHRNEVVSELHFPKGPKSLAFDGDDDEDNDDGDSNDDGRDSTDGAATVVIQRTHAKSDKLAE